MSVAWWIVWAVAVGIPGLGYGLAFAHDHRWGWDTLAGIMVGAGVSVGTTIPVTFVMLALSEFGLFS